MSEQPRHDFAPEPPRSLGGDGQCCGKKPLDYKTARVAPSGAQKFCARHAQFKLLSASLAVEGSVDGTMFVRMGG